VNKLRDVDEGQLLGDWLEWHRCLGLVCRAGCGAKGETCYGKEGGNDSARIHNGLFVFRLGHFLVDWKGRY
jgi:hypothetical protein